MAGFLKTRIWIIVVTVFTFPALWLAGGFFNGDALPTAEQLKKETFKNLYKIRSRKKKEIEECLIRFQKKAFGIENDEAMGKFFSQVMAGKTNDQMEYNIDLHYIQHYGDFYDILFVDHTGVVRHSIKKESDYTKNLFQPPFRDSILSRTLESSSDTKFAEFEYYHPSGEPAAFFTVPVSTPLCHAGWFVLQLAANTLNGVLTDRKGLGRTGEVYLVNEKKLMLTDSRFSHKSTILRKTIATEAVRLGFAEGIGEKIIDDYRGTPVFSSFEKIDILGSTWLLIAEIDEAEVLTDFYRSNRGRILDRFFAGEGSDPAQAGTIKDIFKRDGVSRVDMNEFVKQEGEETLATFGVATCTAVAVFYPEKIRYLAHLSPTDEIYMDSFFTRVGLGERYTNLLEEMFTGISYYDLLPVELKDLEVVVVIPHRASVKKVVDAVLDQGLEIKNIKLMHRRGALSANVQLDASSHNVTVEWNVKNHSFFIHSTSVEDLETVVKKMIGFRS